MQRHKRSSTTSFALSSISIGGKDFNDMLRKCGDFGLYQILLLALFGILNLFVSMHYFTQTIISFVPDHWCYHEKLENMSYEHIEKVYKRFDRPSCTRLDEVYGIDNVTESSEPCTRWIYKYDFGFISMNMQLNWVCDASYKSSVGQSFFFLGSIAGTLTYGFLSDRFGRLPMLALSNFSAFIGDFLTIFCKQMLTFSICRFISGLAVDSNMYLMYIIVLEYVGPKYRTLGVHLMIGIFFCMGQVFLPWLAVLMGNWRYFLCCTSIPMLSICVYYCLVQESAVWLLTRGNINGAIKRLKTVAVINRRRISSKAFNDFLEMQLMKLLSAESQEQANLLDFFRSKHLRKMTFVLFFTSIVITFCFDAVARDVNGFGISPFIVFSVSALAVLPGTLILICFQDYLGRKGMAAISMLFGGITTLVTGLILAYRVEQNEPILILCLISASRLGVSISNDASALHSTELIPACVRGQGVAVIHVAGFISTFLVPYFLLMGNYFSAGPPLILSALLFGGAFATLMLPETANKILPECMADAENFGEGEGLCSFICCQKKGVL